MDRSDEKLIQDYNEGDDEVLAMIFERYKTRVLNFSLRILGNRADAEDVTSEVFLTLFNKRYTYDEGAKFSTWLFTVARNNCISRIRKRKNLVSVWFTNKENGKVDQWDIPDTSNDSSKALEKKEASIQVRKAISNLPLEQREALILREYHDFSYQDISQILECSLDNVKVLIFRARKNLRGELTSFIREANHD